MTATALRPPRSLAIPLGASIVVHVVAVLAILQATASHRVAMPNVYKVRLMAAPAGAPAVGVVNPPKVAPGKVAPPRVTTPKPTPTTARRVPTRTPVKSTPTPPAPRTAAQRAPDQPKAGGGETGGKGADVAAVKLDGLDFPFPEYLSNIVRVIRLRFQTNWDRGYTAEFSFLILRDGSISALRLIDAKGASFEFKLEAQGAIESAGKAKAFGKLPDGFADDALPVVFTFDPRFLK